MKWTFDSMQFIALRRGIVLFSVMIVYAIDSPVLRAQQSSGIDIAGVLSEVQRQAVVSEDDDPQFLSKDFHWWDTYVSQPYRSNAVPQSLSLQEVIYLALQSSEQIRVYSETPLIRETAIKEAAAAFDWTRFAEDHWNDISEPVGSTLTVGGAGNRFLNQQLTGNAGLRRRTMSGGQFDVTQQYGWQDTNSKFFRPNNQATTQLSVGFLQPLMRGRGEAYNQSLIVLAQIDTAAAGDEYSRQLQSHLLEVIRGYRALQLERSYLAQRVRLYQVTQKIYSEIRARQKVDAQPSQLVSTAAALESRRTDLIRAQAAVKNAETKLRAMCNHPAMGDSDSIELVPTEPMERVLYSTDLATEMSLALQGRPEIAAALKDIKAACIRENMSKNELMPQLNLVTRAYVSGLQGNSQIGQSWANQFSQGRPSYSIGVVYEMPIGNHAARARLTRRQLEVRQLQSQYRSAVEMVKAEVDVALRELDTSYTELAAKSRTLAAARAQAKTLEARWKLAPGANGTGTLTLESLLDSQQRVTDAEASLVSSQLTYCLALSNLYRVNGTFLQMENIQLARTSENGLPLNVPDQGEAIGR